MTNESMKQEIIDANPDLNKDFIFIAPSHNFRSTELNAVLGLSQIKKLDSNNINRQKNFKHFIDNLDSSKYITEFEMDGQCNYAFIIVLKDPSFEKRDILENTLKENGIEFRRGLSGGGNQLRQPFFKQFNIDYNDFKVMDHIHHFSWYVGNYPTLEKEKIDTLVKILNSL
jgi:CDP-6-deoxy-D-xylo-4-hexulose-3-dehydrase